MDQVREGGAKRYHEQNANTGKLFARVRIERLVDQGSFVEDAALAHCDSSDYPADGVITGTATLDGRVIALMANDSTVKAGSWGSRTVEKILRIQEHAQKLRCPLLYLVDSAGARITDQVQMFPGRRGAGRIFHNEVKLSGYIPQICLLFGPSAAGGAYIPAFCDVVVMVEGNASMYLGSPRMAEMVIGEKVGLEEMGGARMHCTVSGCGDVLVKSEAEALGFAKRYIRFMPQHCGEAPTVIKPHAPRRGAVSLEQLIPEDENKPFDMQQAIESLVDDGSWLEIKSQFAKELLTGFARIEGRPVGIVANQPKALGGILFVDSADKAARFISLCDAFNIPLLFLADVPGFMIGTKVERQGIIRSGAKMIASMSQASVPKISVVLRKAYGAGLYAMCGPAFEPTSVLALPTASIAVMGAQAAVNAVYYNKIKEKPEGDERAAYVKQLQQEYQKDIDIYHLASEMVIDAIIPGADLRREISVRLERACVELKPQNERKHPVLIM